MEIVLKCKDIELVNVETGFPKSQKVTNIDKVSNTKPEQQKVRLKQTWRQILIGLIISLSALMFGYSLKEITSIPIKKLMKEYSIQSVEALTAQSILIGILPFGSVFGAIITKFLIKRFRRLTGIYIFTIVNIIAIILVNVTTFITLIIGRFMEGICVGYYSAIAPVYLKQIAPKELRKMLGLFFSFGKIIGVLVAIGLQLIFDNIEVPLGWRVILSMTAVFSVVQAILIFFFGSNTPTEMIEKGEKAEAKKIIEDFYFTQYVNEVLHEYQQEYDAEQAKGKQTLSQNSNEVIKVQTTQIQLNQAIETSIQKTETIANLMPPDSLTVFPKSFKPATEEFSHSPKFSNRHPDKSGKKDSNAMNSSLQCAIPKDNKDNVESKKPTKLTYAQKRNYAYCLCLHLCVIRHFTGGNAIISQGGLFIGYYNGTLGTYTALIINSIQFIFIVIGLVYIQKVIGKRPLFLFSITTLSILNIAVAVAMIYENIAAIETLLCVYMMIYGGSFISPIWAYPSEIVPASQALLPNIFHWVALALSTLIPPLVMKVMPHNDPYPVFLFFGFYGFISLIHVVRYLRESDGLTYKEIIKSFG